MKRSTDRILTTHVGSLVRPPKLIEFLQGKGKGDKNYDPVAHERFLTSAVDEAVKLQEKAGVDVPSDGEYGKAISWSQYALERLSGFERRPIPAGTNPWQRGADRAKFPAFYADLDSRGFPTTMDSICTGPIKYTGQEQLGRDIANLRKALEGTSIQEAFLPVAAPASVIPDRKNEYYKTEDDMVEAIAEAMRDEYKMIVDSGFLVQLDDARFAVTFDRMVPPATLQDFRKWIGRHVEVMNHALRDIPEDRIRYHVCWGSWHGPHTTDVPLQDIVDLMLQVKAGAYLIEAANPRHAHEWKVWKDVKLPAGKVLIPGFLSHSTPVVEHPELIADRIVQYAELVGRENVIAGTDCGFAQGVGFNRVHESIQWAKLEALRDGARLASDQLWGRKAAARKAS